MSMPIGGTGGFWIKSGEVQKAGSAARKVAEDIPGEVKTLYTPTDTAVAGLSGWQTATALDTCVEAWAKALKSLGGMVEGAGDAVITSAKGFDSKDEERKREFNGILPPTAGRR
ncbi:hypothetical protein ACFWDI_25080 [Streptomyces sp. NPDC060064]|uniref:hypothetical protein n=1 Tax=Streptomyces sp. NPDC060064 TaxID=3347049 RepID=UPI00369F6422